MISENSRFKLSRSTEMIAHKTWITRSPRFHFNFLGKNSGRGISVPKSLIGIHGSKPRFFVPKINFSWIFDLKIVFYRKIKSRFLARKFKYLLPFIGEELDYSYRFYPLCGNAKSSAKSNFFGSIFFLVRIRALQKRENDNKIFCFWKFFLPKFLFIQERL